MIRLGELELIFRLAQPDVNFPSQWAGLLTSWTTMFPNSRVQTQPVPANAPAEHFRISFFSNSFQAHISLNQVHLYFNPNLENEAIQSFLFNFYNLQGQILKDILPQVNAKDVQVRVLGKVFYPFKVLYSTPTDLVTRLHQGFLSFKPLGTKATNFQLHCGYEDKDHLFKFKFQDYQMRQVNLLPGQQLTPDLIQTFPVTENGLEVSLDLTHLPITRSVEGEVINILRLFALNIDSLPSNFFNNLTSELKTNGPTFN